MIHRPRWRALLALGLVTVQFVTVPAGVCASMVGGHEGGTHDAMTDRAARGHMAHDMVEKHDHTEGKHNSADPEPDDCGVSPVCSAPAIGATAMPDELSIGDLARPRMQGVFDTPAVIVLGLTTPPPKS